MKQQELVELTEDDFETEEAELWEVVVRHTDFSCYIRSFSGQLVCESGGHYIEDLIDFCKTHNRTVKQ